MKDLAEMSPRELREMLEDSTGVSAPADGAPAEAWEEWYVATVVMLFARSSGSRDEAIGMARARFPNDPRLAEILEDYMVAA